MFIKLLLASVVLVAVAVGIGLVEDHHNTLSAMLQNCTRTSDNSGYIGFTCPGGGQVFVPVSEQDQLGGK